MQLVALRLNDLARIFRARYGLTLPDDDAGRDDLELVIHHLSTLSSATRRIDHWIKLWCPWMTRGEQDTLVAKAMFNATPWSADRLAWRLRLTKEERRVLGITTIGAVDYGKGERTKQRKARDRQRKAAKRRAQGVKPRIEYEGTGIERTKPWLAEGISRRTWYRRRGTDTGPSTA